MHFAALGKQRNSVSRALREVRPWFGESGSGAEKSFEEMAYLAEPLGGEIDCPNCNRKMHYSTVETTTIDFCKKCEGVWLDAGELTELSGHLPEGQMTEENAPYEIEIKESDGFLSKVKNIFSKKK